MATGSGKTIIMHINYLQYQFYAKRKNQKITNVILLTPNEDLSKQHCKELKTSGITNLNINNQTSKTLLYDSQNQLVGIKVLDFNKIKDKEDKNLTSNGVTIDYRSFSKNNLIMVDEGHRGSKGDTWVAMRKKIATEGFTFEYSATFQDVVDKKTNTFSSEYKKSIIFDYSYKYFHRAGYGKDYDISNVPSKNDEITKQYVMLGNLLSFYEQKKYFIKNQHELESRFNIEDPLWLLVGSSVNPTSGKDDLDNETKSDIKDFILFLNQLKSQREAIKNKIEQIFTLKADIKNNDSKKNFFYDKFGYLISLFYEEFNGNYNSLLNDLFEVVFYSTSDGKLVLSKNTSNEGEIGLRYSDSKDFFGLIYIGKGSENTVIKDIIDSNKEIFSHNEEITKSWFKTLNEKKDNKPLNLLLGARKFIEGWDNFRISSVLLLNFAKGKGASAIQLFGRGVRLRGYEFAMKRSSHISIKRPESIEVIETLNVFGINADYIKAFKEELTEDGEIAYFIEKKIDVHKDANEILKKNNLYYLRQDLNVDINFRNEEIIHFASSEDIEIQVDTTAYVSNLNSNNYTEEVDKSEKLNKGDYFDEELKSIVDWNKIYSKLLQFKKVKRYNNIVIDSKVQLIELIDKAASNGHITIIGMKEKFNLKGRSKTYQELNEFKLFLEDLYLTILKKYMTRLFTSKIRKISEDAFVLDTLEQEDIISSYTIKIDVDKNEKTMSKGQLGLIMKELIEAEGFKNIIDLEEKKDSILSMQTKDDVFLIEFDRHIYFPLLISKNSGYSLSPTGLNEGEEDFVNQLKKYLEKNPSFTKDKTVALLRNHENIGVGFYLETEKFYYDFILWIVEGDLQKLYFIDPKGLVRIDDQKMKFNVAGIKGIQKQLEKKHTDKKIELYSYIVSQTPKMSIGDELIRDAPEEHNVFMKDNLESLFDNIFNGKVAYATTEAGDTI
jgi:hypothetical protein